MNAIGMSLLVVAFSAAAEPTPEKVPVSAKEVIDYKAEFNDRLSKGIKPETNANVLIVKALGPKPEGGDGHPAKFYKRLGIDPLAENRDYFIGLTAFPRDRLKLTSEEMKTFWDEQGRASKAPWTARDYPQIAAWLEANEKPLALVIEGTKRPLYYDPVIVRRTEKGPGMLMGALMPNVQKSRELAAPSPPGRCCGPPRRSTTRPGRTCSPATGSAGTSAGPR